MSDPKPEPIDIGPASAEDMRVYGNIASGYFKDAIALVDSLLSAYHLNPIGEYREVIQKLRAALTATTPEAAAQAQGEQNTPATGVAAQGHQQPHARPFEPGFGAPTRLAPAVDRDRIRIKPDGPGPLEFSKEVVKAVLGTDDPTPPPWWVIGPNHDVISKDGLIARTLGNKANAHLIKAAPRLKRVAERVAAVGLHEGETPCECDLCSLVRDAQAALRKARG